MIKKKIIYIFFAALTLGSIRTPASAECATIEWELEAPAVLTTFFIADLEYMNCNTNGRDFDRGSLMHGDGKVENALVGSEINLGPAGTASNYTKNEIVHQGINKFRCSDGQAPPDNVYG